MALAQSLARPHLANRWLMYVCGFLTTLTLVGLLITDQGTLLTSMLLATLLCAIFVRSRILTIYVSLAYVTLLGDLRRIRDMVFPHPSLDALLLVTPLVVFALGLPLVMRVKPRDRLSKALLWLLILMCLEVFNPLQGGISIGLTGVLFYVVPVMWFWVGRQYGSPEVTRTFIYKVLLPLTIIASCFGLYQNFVGFLPWEQAWIEANKATLTVLLIGGGNSRSFGFSTNPAEYATLLCIGAAASAAAFFTKKKIWSLAFPVTTIPMFLAGGRGGVVKLLLAIVSVLAVRRSGKLSQGALIRLVVGLVAGFVLVSFAAARFLPSQDAAGGRSTVQAAIAHQTEGLSDPLNERKSTVGLHSQMVLTGFLEGFRMPIGHGLGFATGAASKFGNSSDSPLGSSEVDLSDMFLALGFPGGLLYAYVIVTACAYALRYLQLVPREVSLPAFASIIVCLGAWLTGGQYSTAATSMFLIGCVAYPSRVAGLSNVPAPLLKAGSGAVRAIRQSA